MCEICRKIPCDCRCPNYVLPKTKHVCSLCDGEIFDGEEYIENYMSDCVHFDCVVGNTRWLVNWLGERIKVECDA